ncbi:MAG: cell division protein FtsZ [Bacteroidetes bacterium]|jgi:cell division protein FtsZ|nr:cell division protein FtsZ [Bacteroidota bacterium]
MIYEFPKDDSPIIKVIGVGGGGSNAVTHMYKQGIIGVDFAICNTDNQAMENSPVPTKIRLGPNLTEGRGAGSKPNVGKLACEESIEEVKRYIENNCKMLFITAGMGGGTGTGAAPIIARTAREMNILTVGIVTLPFSFEGNKRTSQGYEGLNELKNAVDTLIIISNDKLRQIHGNLSLSDAFSKADNVLTTAAKGIAEIITVPGYVNVDFEDVNTVMRGSGVAIMGTGLAEGNDRARIAVDQALHSPLLEDNNINGAKHILLNITSGLKEVTMDEIFEITDFVREEAGDGSEIIWGNCYDNKLGNKLSVTVIATGFEHQVTDNLDFMPQKKPISIQLDADSTARFSDPALPSSGLHGIGFEEDKNNGRVVEFDGPDLNKRTGAFNVGKEPFFKDKGNPAPPFNQHQNREEDFKRRELLRAQTQKLNNPKAISDLENEPAYLRRGVRLDEVPSSGENTFSRYTISSSNNSEISEGNSFLHDVVD